MLKTLVLPTTAQLLAFDYTSVHSDFPLSLPYPFDSIQLPSKIFMRPRGSDSLLTSDIGVYKAALNL